MARQIDVDAEIDAVRLKDQGGDPASPASGYKLIYAKSGGFYLINSSGTVAGPITTISKDSLWDAAGDMVYATAADTATKLTIGTANQLLRVNSGATAPEWASVGRVLLATSTPTGTTVSFTSIPATYNSLWIEYVARTDKASVATETITVFFNNDTAAPSAWALR